MIKEFKIEKNVPIPPLKQVGTSLGYRQLQNKFPFRQMECGDSFLYTDKELGGDLQRKIGNAARNWVNHLNLEWKFLTRQTKEGIRIWRIK